MLPILLNKEMLPRPRHGRQGNGPPHRGPLIPSPQTCNQFRNYSGWEDPPTPPAKACFHCGATSHIVKGCNTNPANQNAVGQQAKANFDAFVQKINAWRVKMNKINIPVYSCCVSALVSSSRFSNQSAFVAKQSNGATALADSACSNTIVNNPNLTTRNTPPAMSISIKQANGDLIPVTMQGDLEIHPNLPPLQDVSVVPKCEMNLLSVAHMCETWDASVVLDSDRIRVTERTRKRKKGKRKKKSEFFLHTKIKIFHAISSIFPFIFACHKKKKKCHAQNKLIFLLCQFCLCIVKFGLFC